MIRYFCGKPKSGKSLFCEKYLANHCRSVLYIGTLPSIKMYEETIRIHAERRPQNWDLYECSGDPLYDMDRVSNMMVKYDGMMLDGLSFYISRASFYYDLSVKHVYLFRQFMRKAHELPLELLIVDQPVAAAKEPLRNICRIMHEELYRFSDEIYYIDGGVDQPSLPERLRLLD